MIVTRCPACQTTFRVTPEQLRARQGKVRCGKCGAVFNALDSLVYRADTPAAGIATPSGSGPQAPPAAPETLVESSPLESFESDAEPTAEIASVESAAEPEEAAIPEGELEAAEAAEPADEAAPASRGRAKAILWSLAALLALAALAAQATYVLRSELALLYPAWRPQLEEWCGLLDCEVPLPRQADLVAIEASDLHPDPQRKALLVLQASVRNRAPFAQAYPHLELTLTDGRDQPLSRRVFAPTDYLAKGADPGAGFAANADVAINLWLDAHEVPATGYRLYVFYP